MLDMLEWWIDDPMGSIVKMQQDLGLDPMITTYSQHIGEHEIWPRMLFPRPFETDTWVETFEVTAQGDGWREHSHMIRTPDGDLDYSYRTEDGFGTSCHDFLLKGDEPETKLRRAAALPVGRPLRHDRDEGHGREGRRRGLVAAPRDRAVGHGGRDPRARRPVDGHLRPARVRARPDAVLHRLAEGLLPAARRDRHPLDLDERDLGRRRRRAGPLPRVHEAVREGVRGGRARRRLHGQLPQLRPRDAVARGHGRHRAGRDRDPDVEPLVRATSTSRMRSSESATASACSAGSTSTCSTRPTPTPSATRSSAASTRRWREAATSSGRPARSSTRSPG